MNLISKHLLMGILLSSLGGFAAIEGATPGLTGPGSGGSATYGGTVGFTFSLSSAQPLDSLGLYDVGQAGTQQVGIWDADGTLLASADVPVTSGDSGSFVYSDALTLSGGFTGTLSGSTRYTIGTVGTGYLDNSAAPATSSEVTLLAGNYSGGSGFEYPGVFSSDYYVGPNFTFGAATPPTTPEPGTWALIMGGLAVLALRYSVARPPAER